MSLLQEIKADQLTARKARDTVRAVLLTTLIGEATSIGKNDGNRETTDAEVLEVIRKFVKNMNDSLEAMAKQNVPNATAAIIQERTILMAYLPQQLTETALTAIVQEIVDAKAAPAAIGPIMKVLKANYEGLYDGKMAKAAIEKVLGTKQG